MVMKLSDDSNSLSWITLTEADLNTYLNPRLDIRVICSTASPKLIKKKFCNVRFWTSLFYFFILSFFFCCIHFLLQKKIKIPFQKWFVLCVSVSFVQLLSSSSMLKKNKRKKKWNEIPLGCVHEMKFGKRFFMQTSTSVRGSLNLSVHPFGLPLKPWKSNVLYN